MTRRRQSPEVAAEAVAAEMRKGQHLLWLGRGVWACGVSA
jgi:hypothetical protein